MPLELSVWLTPAILIAVAALLLRSNARLEDCVSAPASTRSTTASARASTTRTGVSTGSTGRLRAVEHGQARLEGLLEGLREAIAGRRPAA